MILPLIAGAIAGIITFIITPWVIAIAKKFNLVDDPKTRFHPAHTHKGIIPRAGGLALFIGIIATAVFFLPLTKLLLGIVLGAIILVSVGLADDRHDISPYIRFATNALAAGVVVALGAGIPYITNPNTGGVNL